MGTNWYLELTLGDLPVSGTRSFNLQVGFRDGGDKNTYNPTGFGWPTTANNNYKEFTRWAGNAFTMTNTYSQTKSGCGDVINAHANVSATQPSLFRGRGHRIEYISFSSPAGLEFRILDVYNGGRSSIGLVTLRLEIDKYTSGRYKDGFEANPRFIHSDGNENKWNFKTTNAGGGNGSTTDSYWWWEFESKMAGWAPSNDRFGPTMDLDGPDKDNAIQIRVIPRNTNTLAGAGFSGMRQFRFNAPGAVEAIVSSVNSGDGGTWEGSV